MAKKSEIKMGAILGYINMIVNLVITIVYTPIMLRLMGQNEYGLYSLVTSVIAYLSVLDMGFGNAMVRFVSRNQAQQNGEKEKRINGLFLLLYTIIGILAFCIGLVLIFNVNNLFGSTLNPLEIKKAKVIMIILVFTVSVSFPLSIFDSYVIASEKFKYIKILNIIKNISIPLIMLPLLLVGFKSIAMVIVTSLFNILFHISTMYYSFKKLKMKIKIDLKNLDKGLIKEIASYSFFIFLSIIVDNLYANTDHIILGSICGTAAVAVYAISAKISQANQTFSTTISGLFLPKITKLLEQENAEEKITNLFLKVSRIQMYIMFLIASGFIVFGKFFINLWVGNTYKDAYYIVLLLIIPAIVPLTQNICISIIQAKNKHKFRSIMYIFIAILNIIISIFLAKKYGAIGAAIGTAIGNILGQIITMNIYYWKAIKIDIPKYWTNFSKIGIPIVFLTLISYFFVNKIELNLIKFMLSVLVYLCAYFIVFYYTSTTEEKNYIYKLLKMRRRF